MPSINRGLGLSQTPEKRQYRDHPGNFSNTFSYDHERWPMVLIFEFDLEIVEKNWHTKSRSKLI